MYEVSRSKWGMVLAALVSVGVAAPAWAQPAAEATWWAGHQVVTGKKKVSLFGSVDTRTDTFFLAQVVPSGSGVEVRQQACRIEVAPTMGVQVSFPEEAARALPVVPFTLSPASDGWHYAQPWTAEWEGQDVDGDGEPGVTLQVKAPLCSGELYVDTTTWSRARVRMQDDLWSGEIRVRMSQRTLGASSRCLSMMSDDDESRMQGTFTYVRVPAGTTCESLDGQPWPVETDPPRS